MINYARVLEKLSFDGIACDKRESIIVLAKQYPGLQELVHNYMDAETCHERRCTLNDLLELYEVVYRIDRDANAPCEHHDNDISAAERNANALEAILIISLIVVAIPVIVVLSAIL